jgi:hypothetical protein
MTRSVREQGRRSEISRLKHGLGPGPDTGFAAKSNEICELEWSRIEGGRERREGGSSSHEFERSRGSRERGRGGETLLLLAGSL